MSPAFFAAAVQQKLPSFSEFSRSCQILFQATTTLQESATELYLYPCYAGTTFTQEPELVGQDPQQGNVLTAGWRGSGVLPNPKGALVPLTALIFYFSLFSGMSCT